MNFLAVALGGAVGSVLRHLINTTLSASLYQGFPWATVAVNVTGSLLIGLLYAVFQHRYPGADVLRLMLITGLLGGFTTFSAFSLETVLLLQNGYWWKALLNIIASVIVCILSAWLGLSLGRWLASQY